MPTSDSHRKRHRYFYFSIISSLLFIADFTNCANKLAAKLANHCDNAVHASEGATIIHLADLRPSERL